MGARVELTRGIPTRVRTEVNNEGREGGKDTRIQNYGDEFEMDDRTRKLRKNLAK